VQPHEALVQIKAFGLNRMDLLQLKGLAYQEYSLGVEFSGVYDGKRVFGLTREGCYDKYVVVRKDMLLNIPENVSFEQAAALPEAYFTALQALQIAGIKRNERILVTAGASGVGSMYS
jgi:tumor protein p53-inducible protein 3